MFHSPRHSVIGSILMEGMESFCRGVFELCIGFTRSSISSWNRFSGRGEVNERAGLYVIPDTPMPTSRLLPGLKCSMSCFFFE